MGDACTHGESETFVLAIFSCVYLEALGHVVFAASVLAKPARASFISSSVSTNSGARTRG